MLPSTLSTEEEVVRRCLQLLSDEQPAQAIRWLDKAFGSIRDIGAHHRVLMALEQELLRLIDHHHPDNRMRLVLLPGLETCLGCCPNIGQAIRDLSEADWWHLTQAFFVPPLLRELMTRLSDPRSRREIIVRQAQLMLAQGEGLIDPDDFKWMLERLQQAHRLASEALDDAAMGQVLPLAHQLLQRLSAHTGADFIALQAPCAELINACQTPGALRAMYGMQSRIELSAVMHLNDGQWEWHWTRLQYPKLPPSQQLQHEQTLFYADISALLKGAPPAPWGLVKKAEALTSTLGWVPAERQWVLWAFELALKGDMGPLIEQLKLIDSKRELRPIEPGASARDQFFLCLRDRIKTGMPWSVKTILAGQVKEQLGWSISAKDEWALHLLCAQGGDAEPMIEMLKSQLPEGFIDRDRLQALHALCQGNLLKAEACIRLIAALRPHLDNAPALRQPFNTLLRSFDVPPSASTAQPTTQAALTADELVRRARDAMAPWFTFGVRHGQVTINTSPGQAPGSLEDKERFNVAFFTLLSVELIQESANWQGVMHYIDMIERIWNASEPVIERNMLLEACIQHVQRTNNSKALQDHLPRLIEADPSARTLLELLEVFTNPDDASPLTLAPLLPHLLTWVRSCSDTKVHTACVRAILSLPAGDVRAVAMDRFADAYGGDPSILQLFGTVSLLQEATPPPLQRTLNVPGAPTDRGAWPGWRALCAVLWDGIAERLSAALTKDDTQEKTGKLLLNALASLATPASKSMALAIPRLFDLLGDLARAIPDNKLRLSFLNNLHACSLQWPGQPELQAAVRGILEAFIAQESNNALSLPPASSTHQPVIDQAVPLFTRGILYWMALQRDNTEPARTHLHELELLWDRSTLKTNGPAMAQLIAGLFALNS